MLYNKTFSMLETVNISLSKMKDPVYYCNPFDIKRDCVL